jgi:hypothetical protein
MLNYAHPCSNVRLQHQKAEAEQVSADLSHNPERTCFSSRCFHNCEIVWGHSYSNTIIEFIVLIPSLVPGSATVYETQIRPDSDDIIRVEVQCRRVDLATMSTMPTFVFSEVRTVYGVCKTTSPAS